MKPPIDLPPAQLVRRGRCLHIEASFTPRMIGFAQALFDETDRLLPAGADHVVRLWPEVVRILAQEPSTASFTERPRRIR